MKTINLTLFGSMLLLVASRGFAATGMANVTGTNEDSEIEGTLKFEEVSGGLKVTGQIENVPVGEHGFHIHEFGDCGDEAKNAGGHYNPDQKPHGLAMHDPGKVHPGDMGNITAKEDGLVSIDVMVPGLTLAGGKYPVAGRAVILHEKKDDFGQPTGNAGGRIGCGAIVLTGK